jgi:Ca2+-binding RTX toxin-like protein
MPRILIAAALTVAAAIAVPSAAQAATVHQEGNKAPHRILVQDTVGETNLMSVKGSKSVVIEDLIAPIEIERAPTCMPLDAYTVKCAGVRILELDLGAGPDHANIDTQRQVELDGGHGNDHYLAAATTGPSRVDFAGGIGLDTANYFYATAGVDVSVDVEHGDGRPGDDDRVLGDVESVIGSNFDDVLTGSDRTLKLSGSDGDDVITGGSAAETLLGGPGNDRIEARDGAADTIDCGGWLLDRATIDVDAEASVKGCTVS